MKKFLLNASLALMICFSACNKADNDPTTDENNDQPAHFASTAPENKNVVLEDFTGVRCGYCPDGHVRAKALSDANPGRIVIIAVHAGPYAAPMAGWADFTTSFGQALVDQSSVTGYPAGTINRRVWTKPQTTGGLAMSRGEWANASAPILAEVSPVNIGIKKTYNSSTRELAVSVELYYTADGNVANNLNVALLENKVMSKQSGGTPDANNYEQNHILRNFLTGQWGEAIGVHKKGEYVTKTYKYTVPANVNMDNADVAAYVAEGNKNIITGKVIAVK